MELAIGDVRPFYLLIISLLLGLLVGLQRQWAESPLGGFRTFSLVSVFGTTCALLAEKYGSWLMLVGFLTTLAIIVSSHLTKNRSLKTEYTSLASEFAMLLTFASGAIVYSGPIWLAAAISGIVAVILQAKIELHGLAARFSAKELKAIMQFVLISLVILPIVPNKTFGPLDVFNPHDTWLMVVLIVAISLSGYIIYKFFGERAGVLLSGILGGIISSTATTMNYSRLSKENEYVGLISNALIILIAWSIVYVRLFVEITVVSPSFQAVWFPLITMFLVSMLSTLWVWRSVSRQKPHGMPQQTNPTELKTALTFGIIYSCVLFAVAFAKNYFGQRGLTVVAVLSGITDMDAITLSTARLVETKKVLPAEGWPIIIISLISNTFFKGLLVGSLGGKRFFKIIAVPWAATLLAGILLLIIW